MSQQQDKEYLMEASRQVSTEIDLARSTLPDYRKKFTLKTFPNQNYEITILDKQELVTTFNNLEYVVFLKENINGQLNDISDNSTNMIYKTDGIILLPNGSVYKNDSLSGLSINVNPEKCYLASINNPTCQPEISNPKELDLCNQSWGLCGQ
jgi:hypothetical protein